MKTRGVFFNNAFKALLWVWFKSCYRLRSEGAQHCPRRGGVLVVANHQSFLDPMLLGVALPRPLVYTPRQSLKKSPLYRLLTAPLDLEHVERDGRDLAATRRMIERLRAGDVLAIFPEQTRTLDGVCNPITPGFHVLAAKAGVPVLPVVIDGAFEVWPRGRKRPRLFGRIRVRAGAPLDLRKVERNDAARQVEAAWGALGARLEASKSPSAAPRNDDHPAPVKNDAPV